MGMNVCDLPPDGSLKYYQMYAGAVMFAITIVVMMLGAAFRMYLEVIEDTGTNEKKRR